MNERVILFTSRNKDNRHIPGFKERTHSFVSTRSNADLYNEFRHFTSCGLEGEFCRMYVSINEVDIYKVNMELAMFLIKNLDYTPAALPQKAAHFASFSQNKSTKRWLFDCDDMTKEQVMEFISDVKETAGDDCTVELHETPHGFAVITGRGMDTRKLMEKWGKNVELKRDAMLCLRWETNN